MFTCDGDDLSPHLAWDEVPEGVKSFAIIVDDPDAPMGTWVHWLIANIPGSVRELTRGLVPTGATQVRNNFGKLDYGGPCPPGGTHRYFFKLFALKVERLEGLNENNFYQIVEDNKLATAVLMGKYSRR
jgi:Raf kinase inhibitor-like YbhB/YbcL family protein